MLSILVIGQKAFVSGEALDKVRDCLHIDIVECLSHLRELDGSRVEVQLFADQEGYAYARGLCDRFVRTEALSCQVPELLSRKLGQYMVKLEGGSPKANVVVLEALGEDVWWHADVMSDNYRHPPEKLIGCGLAAEKDFVMKHLAEEVERFKAIDPEMRKAEQKILQEALPKVLEGLRLGQSMFEIQFPNKTAKVSAKLLKAYLEWRIQTIRRLADMVIQSEGTDFVLIGGLMGKGFEELIAHIEAFSTAKSGKKKRMIKRLLGMTHQELCDQLYLALQPTSTPVLDKKKAEDAGNQLPGIPDLENWLSEIQLANRHGQAIAEGIGHRLIRLQGRYLVVQANDPAPPVGMEHLVISDTQVNWAKIDALRMSAEVFPLSYKHVQTKPWIDEIELAAGDWMSLWHCLSELNRIGVPPSQRNLFADAVTDSLMRLLAAYYHPDLQACLGAGLVGLPTLHADALLLHLDHRSGHFWKIRNPELRLWTLGFLPSELGQPGMQSYLDWWAKQQLGLPLPPYWRDIRAWDVSMDAQAICTIVLALAGPDNAEVAINARLVRLLRLGKRGRVSYETVRRIAYPPFWDRLANTFMDLKGAPDVEITTTKETP